MNPKSKQQLRETLDRLIIEWRQENGDLFLSHNEQIQMRDEIMQTFESFHTGEVERAAPLVKEKPPTDEELVDDYEARLDAGCSCHINPPCSRCEGTPSEESYERAKKRLSSIWCVLRKFDSVPEHIEKSGLTYKEASDLASKKINEKPRCYVWFTAEETAMAEKWLEHLHSTESDKS